MNLTENLIEFIHKHPYDWILHFIICLVAGILKTSPFVAIGGMFLFEYEQRFQKWYLILPLKTYILKHSLLDMVFNLVGYFLGCWLKSLY